MDNNKSNTHVTDEGEVLKSIVAGKEVLCPTCHGRGEINDPKCYGKAMGYCDKNGNSMPQITCRTCAGNGWVIAE